MLHDKKSLSLLAIGVLVIVGLGALHFSEVPSRLQPDLPPARQLDGLSHPRSFKTAPTSRTPAALVEVEQERGSSPAPDFSVSPLVRALNGSIVGSASDWNGDPLIDRLVVVFRGRDPLSRARRYCWSDKDGLFHFTEVPPGEWRIGLGGTERRFSGSMVGAIGVDVPSGARVVCDLVERGPFALSGVFTMSDSPNESFELELIQSGAIIGEGETHVAPPPHLVRARPQSVGGAKVWPTGYFEFAGLAPGEYVIRIPLGVEPDSGQVLVFERHVALDGNLELPSVIQPRANFYQSAQLRDSYTGR